MVAVAAGSALPALGTAQSPVPGGTAASLGQAIAEAARSPLRPGGQAVGYDGTPVRIPIGGVRFGAPPTDLAGDLAAPATDSIATGVVGFTLIASMVSHFATAYALKDDPCGFHRWDMAVGCWAAPVIPWGLVGAPAASAGIGARAFVASGYGALAGVVAFFIARWRGLNRYGGSLVSGFTHFVVAQALFR